ncbi:MAG: hypothetical protein QF902_03390 [Rhodospirillales bacterium]|nr:hypothetical protein [Rhodospirillales bacterium]
MGKHTFEIHSLHQGRWKFEATCDNREAAFDLARELVESPEKESVCVVAKTHDVDTGKTTTRTDFFGSAHSSDAPAPAKDEDGPQSYEQFFRYVALLVLAVGGFALIVLAAIFLLSGQTIRL